MARVIGEAPEALKHATCHHCAARLEYAQKEVKAYHGKDYSGGADGKEWIDCPRCGGEVILRAW
jgi:DNA-directed RNA polymerase subunit RPC12/RpoP